MDKLNYIGVVDGAMGILSRRMKFQMLNSTETTNQQSPPMPAFNMPLLSGTDRKKEIRKQEKKMEIF